MFAVLFVVVVLKSHQSCFAIDETSFGQLDQLELEKERYEIEIESLPVTEKLLSERTKESFVRVFSKRGQQYSCAIPLNTETSTASQQNYTGDIDIQKILAPLKDTCILMNQGWWTYEYCHGDKITQFHIESGKIKGNVVVLGYFEKEADWTSAKLQKELEKHEKEQLHQDQNVIKLPAHIIDYTNGSYCELSSTERAAMAKIICSPYHHSSEIVSIFEHETCNYTLIIHSPLLCDHPLFGLHNIKASSKNIKCSPIISEEHYESYMKTGLASRQAVKETLMTENKKTQRVPLMNVLQSLASSIADQVNAKLESKGKTAGDNDGSSWLDTTTEEMIDKLVDNTLENVFSTSVDKTKSKDSQHENKQEEYVKEQNTNKDTKNTDETTTSAKRDKKMRVFHVKLNDEASLDKADIDEIVDQMTTDISEDQTTNDEDKSEGATAKKSKPAVIEIDLSKQPKSKETANLLANAIQELFSDDEEVTKQRTLEKNYEQSWDQQQDSGNKLNKDNKNVKQDL